MSAAYHKKFVTTWEEIQRYSMALAWRVGPKAPSGNPWRGIIAVARGGLVPAAAVARELHIRLIDTICLQSYTGKKLGKTSIIKDATLATNGGKDWLIIDDLVDTGHTAKIVRKMLPKAHFATLYAKPKGLPYVDSYLMEFSQDTWIYFPWEVEQQYKSNE
ncbi:MAG: xanthine phosphoribosyltransferase [Alphaproteobacteria bacterium]|nr:xanthine phosphoribosyltransferase [Alphaproteobacteria bacterium]